MKWTIIYDGGDTFSDTDGDWQDAPSRGVLVIVIEDETVGRQLAWGFDFYWWFPGQAGPSGGDLFGMRDYLTEIGSRHARADFNKISLDALAAEGIKFGRSVDNTVMRAALAQAASIEGFEPKSAWLPIENLPPQELGGRR